MQKSGVLSGGYEGRSNARVDLGERYGEIGISAVAAAVRYQGPTKNATDERDDGRRAAEQAA